MRLADTKEQNITVDKAQLITKLKENMARHIQTVKEAEPGYVRDTRTKLNAALRSLRGGKPVAVRVNAQPSPNHAKVYEAAIAMFEADTGTTFILSSTEFRRFWLDEWEWSEGFWAANSSYSATAKAEVSKYQG